MVLLASTELSCVTARARHGRPDRRARHPKWNGHVNDNRTILLKLAKYYYAVIAFAPAVRRE